MDYHHTSIDAGDLKHLLEGPQRPVLIDVRLAEDFEVSHLPGSQNNCVFEVAFMERMPGIAPDKEAPVCLYGADSSSLESRMAAEKLLRDGYANVFDFTGGIGSWKAAGFSTEGHAGGSTETPVPANGVHAIDLAESRIHWIGRNLLNRHEGSISLTSGWIRIEDGNLTEGLFSIDMSSIKCTDLDGDPLQDVLIKHLLSHDFFDTSMYPEASFRITGSQAIPDATPGMPNQKIAGILTLKGISKPLEFASCTGVTENGKAAAQATLAFDRTLWNVIYGSGKWFRSLGGHLVNDLVELQLRIVTA